MKFVPYYIMKFDTENEIIIFLSPSPRLIPIKTGKTPFQTGFLY